MYLNVTKMLLSVFCISETYESFKCDFETDTCDMIQSQDDNGDWLRHKGPTSSSNTGPSADHTKGAEGYYMYIDASSMVKQLLLLSPVH